MTGIKFFTGLASACGAEPIFEKKTIWTPKHGSRTGNWLDVWTIQFKVPCTVKTMPLLWLLHDNECPIEPNLLYVPCICVKGESQSAIANCFIKLFKDAFKRRQTVSIWVKFANGMLCEKAKSLEEIILQAELNTPTLPGKYAVNEEVFV